MLVIQLRAVNMHCCPLLQRSHILRLPVLISSPLSVFLAASDANVIHAKYSVHALSLLFLFHANFIYCVRASHILSGADKIPLRLEGGNFDRPGHAWVHPGPVFSVRVWANTFRQAPPGRRCFHRGQAPIQSRAMLWIQ
jgi:hypothetical protein